MNHAVAVILTLGILILLLAGGYTFTSVTLDEVEKSVFGSGEERGILGKTKESSKKETSQKPKVTDLNQEVWIPA